MVNPWVSWPRRFCRRLLPSRKPSTYRLAWGIHRPYTSTVCWMFGVAKLALHVGDRRFNHRQQDGGVSVAQRVRREAPPLRFLLLAFSLTQAPWRAHSPAAMASAPGGQVGIRQRLI